MQISLEKCRFCQNAPRKCRPRKSAEVQLWCSALHKPFRNHTIGSLRKSVFSEKVLARPDGSLTSLWNPCSKINVLASKKCRSHQISADLAIKSADPRIVQKQVQIPKVIVLKSCALIFYGKIRDETIRTLSLKTHTNHQKITRILATTQKKVIFN